MNKCFLLSLIIWIIFQPQNGVAIDENTLERTLNQECVTNQAAKTLKELRLFKIANLYGGHRPTIKNFNPGSEFLEYIKHFDAYDLPEIRFLSQFKQPEHTVITTFDYIKESFESSTKNNLLLITGRRQTGKTTILKLIGSHLEESYPSESITYIDLSTFSANNRDHLTLDDILQGSMKKEFIGLFKNVAEINPWGVRILLDGIDQVPQARDKILSLIKDLHVKNIKIIMTANLDIYPHLSRHDIRPREIKIPTSMSSTNFNKYMANYLIPNIHKDGPFWDEQSFIKNYLQTIRIAIQDTPFPQVIGIIEKLAQEIKISGALEPFPSLDDFVEIDDLNFPREALKKSDYIQFNKYKFYNDFFRHLNPDINFYGPRALQEIFKSSDIIQREIQEGLTLSNKLLSTRGEESFDFISFQNGIPDKFLHREYKRYFASKYIINSLTTESSLVETFKTIMHDSKHKYILEFINSAINSPEYTQNIRNRIKILASSNTEYLHATIDNLIRHKMDNLCSEMFKEIGKDRVKAYLEESKILASKNKYNFGMLADSNPSLYPDYMPRKTPWQYTGTRAQMVVNLEMKKSLETWRTLGYVEDPSIFLDYYAKKGIKELNTFLEQFPEHKYPVESLNKAMFESLNSLGEESLKVLNKLWDLGAQPNNFQVDKKTLAHIAAEKSSKILLKTVHENYNVPLTSAEPVNFDKSVLASALDSNPFPSKTRDGFWPMMEYLLPKINLLQYIELIKEFLPTIPHVANVPSIVEGMICHLNVPEIDAIDLLKRFVHPTELDLSPGILTLRRNTVIKSGINAMISNNNNENIISMKNTHNGYVTISEIIIQHRGRDALNLVDEKAYTNAVKYLLQKEGKTFNKFQIKRVYELLLKNAESSVQLHRINEWVIQDVFSTFTHEIYADHAIEFSNIFRLRDNNRLLRVPVANNLQHQILATIYDWAGYQEDHQPNNLRLDNLHDDLGYESPGENFICQF